MAASYRKDLKKVFAEIRRQDPGVRFEESGGHIWVKSGDGVSMVRLPGSPSDHRAWLNLIKQLERTCGYDLRRFRK